MTTRSLRHAFLVVSFIIIAACAQAAVVTVTPENMQGWSIETNCSGYGALTTGGPAVYETVNGFGSFGRGAFYATCDMTAGIAGGEDKTPSTVWLGTDKLNGQAIAGKKLSEITKLEYYSYVSKNPVRHGGSLNEGTWDSWSWWRYPKQPIMLQLTVRAPDSLGYGPPYNRAQLLYRPWGTAIKGDDYNEKAFGTWQNWNCMAQGRWMLSPGNSSQTPGVFESWAAVLATFGDWTLMPTSTTYGGSGGYGEEYKSAGWNNSTNPPGWTNTTATGKPINFEVGARLYQIKWPNETSATNWWSESTGFRGHVDYFTLAINGLGEATYNFEPSATEASPRVVATTMKSFNHKIIQSDSGKNKYMIKVTGKVIARLNAYFSIDDGGVGLPMRVYWMNNDARVGDYWSVWGYAEYPRWFKTGVPMLIWTDPSHCDLQYP